MSEHAGRPERPPLRLAVLGPVAVRRPDGTLVEPSGSRAKALLVALVLAAPRPLFPERLTSEVWGDDAPRGARAALQTLVSRIRSAFGDSLIESLPSGYRLGLDPEEVDLTRAERLLDDARTAVSAAEWPAAASAASLALGLWRGDPGGDLDGEGHTEALAARAAHALDGLEAVLATASLALMRSAEAEELARRLCERAPFDDSAHLLLMRALDALGRPTDAVAVYAGFRERVQEAFGTSPALELQALNLELLDREVASAGPGAHTMRPAAGTAAESASAVPVAAESEAPPRAGVARGIRASPNSLIGRADAVRAIEALIATARVTTVLGAGGLGKTRVAHEVAARALSAFGAVIVVELASVRSADDVVFGIASALGIREAASSTRLGDRVPPADLRTRILNRLAGTRTLLVIDNCEHLIDAAAEWCALLTAELPELSVLTTSRTPLAISSERVYELAPLGTGRADADDDAVTLFLDRATAVRPGAALPREAVARLCARLDGLPLAIELAAARVRTMSIDEIERRLSNRFALLAGGDRSAPERHRTLLAVIDWSWNLLAAAEQRALTRLSEFADGFGAEAASVVLGVDDAGPVLEGLLAQSLVLVRESPFGLRYRMLETVREFGRLQLERAGTTGDAGDALLDWSARFALAQRPHTDGARQVETFALVALEEDNLVDCLRRAIDAGRPDAVVALFALLGYYWSLRSAHTEVAAFGVSVWESVRAYDPPDAVQAEALSITLVLIAATSVIGDLRLAVRPISRLRKLVAAHPLSDPRLSTVASIVLAFGREDVLQRTVEEAIASSDRATALLGSIIGSVGAENQGRRDEAVALARSAARLAEGLDDTWGQAMAGQMLGALHSQSAEPVEALRWARRARVGLAALGAREDIRQLEWTIATNAIAVGDLDEAAELFGRLVESPGEADGGDIRSIGLAGQAEVLRARGQVVQGRALYLEALSAFHSPGARSSPWFRMVLSAVLSALVLDGTGEAEEERRLARRLRARTLASFRAGPSRSFTFIDQPVLGASVVGLVVWVADLAATGAESPLTEPEALELLALAEAMGSRQDSPALHLAPVFGRLTERLGERAVQDARTAASALPDPERPVRVEDLLRRPGPWSWAWDAATADKDKGD